MSIKFPCNQFFDNSEMIRNKLVEIFNYNSRISTTTDIQIDNQEVIKYNQKLPDINTNANSPVIKRSYKRLNKENLLDKYNNISLIKSIENNKIKYDSKKSVIDEFEQKLFKANEDYVDSINSYYINLGSLPYLVPNKKPEYLKNTNTTKLSNKTLNDLCSFNDMYDYDAFKYYPTNKSLNKSRYNIVKTKSKIYDNINELEKRKNENEKKKLKMSFQQHNPYGSVIKK